MTDTLVYPYTSVVRIEAVFPNGATILGSGAMIDEYHVLTAGHVVHDVDLGGFAVDFNIFPAQNGSEQYFGEADWTFVRTYSGWTDSQNSDFDMALITLDRNIGIITGWMGREVLSDSNFNNGISLNTAGYPGDLSTNAVDMYRAFGAVDSATVNRVFYSGLNGLDTFGGQSGSPLYRYNSSTDERYINVVHTTGGSTLNGGTRLNQPKFDDLIAWTAEDDGVRQPTDRPDLVDWDEWFGTDLAFYSSGIVIPGQSWSVTSYPRNNGTLATGNYTVSFYASTNPTISTSDALIGTVSLGAVDPFNWDTAAWSGNFPSLANGTYYIGWVIDSGGVVGEFLEGNNTGFVDQPITVATDDNYEPNDTLATAADPNNNGGQWAQQFLSTINGPGIANNQDWYEISVTSGFERLIVDLQFTHANGDIDLQVVDANGTVFTGGYSTTDNETIDVVLPTAGTWYLQVYPFSGSGNSYDLRWDDVAPSALPDLAPVSFDLDATNDELTAGGTYSLDFTYQNIGAVATGTNYDVGFYLSTDSTINPGTDRFLGFIDGVKDVGEPTQLSAADGTYTFIGLAAATYVVREVRQTGFEQTYPIPPADRGATGDARVGEGY